MKSSAKQIPDFIISQVVFTAACPRCGRGECPRHSFGHRFVRDVVGMVKVNYSKHWCERCRKHFSNYDPDFAAPQCQYSRKFIALAVARQGRKTLEKAARELQISPSTLYEWVHNARKERMRQMPPASGTV